MDKEEYDLAVKSSISLYESTSDTISHHCKKLKDKLDSDTITPLDIETALSIMALYSGSLDMIYEKLEEALLSRNDSI